MQLFKTYISIGGGIIMIFALIMQYLYFASTMYDTDLTEGVGITRSPIYLLGLYICFFLMTIKKTKKSIYSFQKDVLYYFLIAITILSYVGIVYIGYPALSELLLFPLPLLFYHSSYKITLELEDIRIFLWGYCILFLFLFIYYLSMRDYVYTWFLKEENQNSASYMLLHFFPLVLCFPNKWIKMGVSIIVISSIFLSLKKGGIIALAVGGMLYFVVWTLFGEKRRMGVIRLIISFILIILVVYSFQEYNKTTSNLFINRFDDDNMGSGRVLIWEHTWQMIIDSDLLSLMFGHGYNAVAFYSSLKSSAHNDFLEIIYDYGVIGFTLFIALIWKLLTFGKRLCRLKSVYAPPFMMSVGIFAVNICVSHVILYIYYFSIYCIFWGFLFAIDKKTKNIAYM